jgi:hypothetical protein
MLEILGFLVWVAITIGLSIAPYFILALSALGGGVKRTEGFMILLFIVLASFSWYNIFSSLNISLN